ncbi:MAG: AAA family ATPase [Bifidobacteriaceae bacterium]|nr:AAA family ATPase [Bifidobacteriaceae bacterium]
MELSSLHLKNFRACQDTTVEFAPDLTVLVGENAAGKSAIIDALSLATFAATPRQAAWFDATKDLTNGADPGAPVEISARYGGLSELEKAVYMAELLDSHEDLVFTTAFATSPGTPRRSIATRTVGDLRADDPEPALRQRIAHVYLPPLRDAVRDLDGADQAQLYEVMRIVLADDGLDEDDFVGAANQALKAVAEHGAAERTRETIDGFFRQTMPPTRAHGVDLAQKRVDLRGIARMLRIHLTERGIQVGDIASTGLGYANLLYIAMLTLQLAKARENDLTLLLVEEPEAHLHPQLQLVLLDFLLRQAQESSKPTGELEPAGRIQVVLTTHSPVLASTVSIRNVVVVSRCQERDSWCCQAAALGALDLEPAKVRAIDRYLNATRANLLFARDVVLVEGIAELLLLPALADYHLAGESGTAGTAPGEHEAGAARRQFASASVVAVEGVDFEPYLHLLLDGARPRVDRVVVITDGDRDDAGFERRKRYENLFPYDVAAGRLKVVVAPTTLEAELFRSPQNEPILKEAYLVQHPRSRESWEKVSGAAAGLTGEDERARLFAAVIGHRPSAAEPSLAISKGEFAHVVAEAVADRQAEFAVPKYLREAIDYVARNDELAQ